MLPGSDSCTHEDIDADSTAVLAFDDGTRIPCDRFIMRLFCSVVRTLLESSECAVDVPRGRTIIPMPGQDPGAYRLAVDLLHAGCGDVWKLDAPSVVSIMRCMAFLGCTAYDLSLDARLWTLLRDAPLETLMDHAPRFIRNPAMSAVVIRRMIKLRPRWTDFAREVLAPLESFLDPQLVAAVMAYAPNFFPPALVATWALAYPRLSREAVLRLAAQHGVMYHPGEMPVVVRRLAEVSAGWQDDDLTRLLRMMVTTMEKYDTVPLSAHRVHGTLIKFHDVHMASVCASMEGRLPKGGVKMTPWLRLTFSPQFEAVFKPRKIDELSAGCTHVQVRIMCMDKEDIVVSETWFVFEDVQSMQYDLSHATYVVGRRDETEDAIRRNIVKRLRMDFFYGYRSVLDSPFDTGKSVPTFLPS